MTTDQLTLEKAESCVRSEGANEYWYINPNQFTAEDERTEMASTDPEVDLRIYDELEACEIGLRLAEFLEAPVTVSKHVQSGAFYDCYEEDKGEAIVVTPRAKAA